MLQSDFWPAVPVHGLHPVAPEHAAFHDIGHVHRSDPAPPCHGECKGDLGDAVYLGFRIELRVDGVAAAIALEDTPRLSEIDARGILSHNNKIGPVNDVRSEGGLLRMQRPGQS